MLKLEINHILVPIDFSETSLNALDQAAALAKKFEAKLTLFHIFESFGSDSSILPSLLIGEKSINNPLQEKVVQKLDELRNGIANIYSKDVNIAISEGTIASAVEEFTKEEKVDLIVMGTHGTKGVIQNYIIGSNSYKVVGSANVPVLTVRKSANNTEFKNIVVPIDFTRFSRQKLPVAVGLAQKYDATLRLFITDQNDEQKAKNTVLIEQVENYLRSQGVQFTTEVSKNYYSAKEVINYAEQVKADLMVIMSERETTISNLILGPISRDVVNHSLVPVLTVHPYEDNGYLDIWK